MELVREALVYYLEFSFVVLLLWCLWKEQNQQTFEDLDGSQDQMLASFSGTLFDWSRAWGLMTSDSPFIS